MVGQLRPEQKWLVCTEAPGMSWLIRSVCCILDVIFKNHLIDTRALPKIGILLTRDWQCYINNFELAEWELALSYVKAKIAIFAASRQNTAKCIRYASMVFELAPTNDYVQHRKDNSSTATL